MRRAPHLTLHARPARSALLLCASLAAACDRPASDVTPPAAPSSAALASAAAPEAPPVSSAAAPPSAALLAVAPDDATAPSSGGSTSAVPATNPCRIRYEERVDAEGKSTRVALPKDRRCNYKGEGGITKTGAYLGY